MINVNRAAEIEGNFLNNIPAHPNHNLIKKIIIAWWGKSLHKISENIRERNRWGGRKSNKFKTMAHLAYCYFLCQWSWKRWEGARKESETMDETAIKLPHALWGSGKCKVYLHPHAQPWICRGNSLGVIPALTSARGSSEIPPDKVCWDHTLLQNMPYKS